ncbi:MAG: hypothetical protein VX278_23050 [Myxococcota bacterium]|nr:hypothetical protein [Myxococcota bacterium]
MPKETKNLDLKSMSNRSVRSFVRLYGKTRFKELLGYMDEDCPKEWICGEFKITEAQYHEIMQLKTQTVSQSFRAQTN